MIKRKEIRSLPPEELLAYRKAMMQFQANLGVNGYHEIAGYHGSPCHFCHQAHNDLRIFLAWHRYYIYFFESELRKIDSNVSLPYWNWANEKTFMDSIAPAHKDSVFIDSDGTTKPNPLFSALIDNQSRQTRRHPDLSTDVLQTAKNSVDFAYRSKDFLDVNISLDGPHQSIHTHVRCDFGSTDLTAYDPLFWSHHATVDRQWAIWQNLHPDLAVPDERTLNLPLPGFPGKTVGDVIDYRTQLGYEYDNLDVTLKFHDQFFILAIRGIHRTEQPFSIEVFLKSSDRQREVKAGVFGIFGMSKMNASHHDSFVHPMVFDEFIDVTEALEELAVQKNEVQPVFLVRDKNGNVVDPSIFEYSTYEIK